MFNQINEAKGYLDNLDDINDDVESHLKIAKTKQGNRLDGMLRLDKHQILLWALRDAVCRGFLTSDVVSAPMFMISVYLRSDFESVNSVGAHRILSFSHVPNA